MKKKPNILWICTDQQRFDTINYLGNKFINTPNLNRLCKEGIAFEKTYCQCPVCSPSRASFLTSRYPHITGLRQNGQKIPDTELLVTKILADNKYNCALAGKLHLAPCEGKVEERIDDGYKEFYWSHGPFPKWSGANDYIQWLKKEGKEWSDVYPYSPDISAKLGPDGIAPGGEIVWDGVSTDCHQTTWCANKAMEFIESCGDNPWLVSVNPFDPHHPFDPPQEFLDKYDPDNLPSPLYREGELNNKPQFQNCDSKGAYGGDGISFKNTTDYQHRQIKAGYYAMIELIDYNVGRLLNYLEETNQRENTIVIFMSDHGEMLGDHGIFLKGPYPYEPLIRVPFIISWPKHFQEDVRTDALVELIDIAPTILEAAGIPMSPRMQGKSLFNICTGKKNFRNHRDYIYTEYYNALATHRNPTPYITIIRDERYKIAIYHGLKIGELYDLQEDPNEFRNLWFEEDYSKLKWEYLKKAFDASAFTMDPCPLRRGRY